MRLPRCDFYKSRFRQQRRNLPHVGLHHTMTDQAHSDMGQDGIGRWIEISQQEPPAWFQHPEDLLEALPFQLLRQVMDHEPADDHVEGHIRVGIFSINPSSKTVLKPLRFVLFRATSIISGEASIPYTAPYAPVYF